MFVFKIELEQYSLVVYRKEEDVHFELYEGTKRIASGQDTPENIQKMADIMNGKIKP